MVSLSSVLCPAPGADFPTMPLSLYCVLHLVLSDLCCSLDSILCCACHCLSCGAHQALFCSAAGSVSPVVLIRFCSVRQLVLQSQRAHNLLCCAAACAVFPVVLFILYPVLKLLVFLVCAVAGAACAIDLFCAAAGAVCCNSWRQEAPRSPFTS
jgi:hypothetical protein